MATGKPSSLNLQSEAIAKERSQSREELKEGNQKGLEWRAERIAKDLRARYNHDFLGKEAPDEAADNSGGGQMNCTELIEVGRRSPQVREDALWGNPKTVLGSFGGAINAHQRSRGASDLSGEAEEGGAKVEVAKMEDYLEEKGELQGGNAFAMDMQRTLFREFHYLEAEGPRETCSRLWYLCHRWLKPERHSKEQILELVILEQFLAILPLETQSWVKGGCPRTCDQAVALAEDFLQRRQETQELEWEDQVPVRDVGLKMCAPNMQPSLPNEKASRLTAMEGRDNDISSQTAEWWMTGSKRVNPSIAMGQPVKHLETPWGSSLWPKEDEECPPRPGESEKVRKTYLTPRVDLLFPYLEESEDVNQNVAAKRKRRTRGEKVCSVCGRSFSRTTVLVAHQRTHTGEKPFMCKDCGKCFSLKSTLVAHERTHTGERPYSCSQCGKSFTVSSDLTRHYRIHVGEKPFSCLQCDKSFSRKTQLLNHQKVHTREKPYKCSQCGESFNRSSSLMIHEGSHLGQKPFKCPDCEKSFNTSSQLVKHHRVHTGERPYTCSECGKSFSQRQILMVHQRIHTGEKPFKCATCGKCFCDRAVLIRHQKVHTGERPHECTTCGKSFSHRAVLVRHQKIHTRDALNYQRLEEDEGTPSSRHVS